MTDPPRDPSLSRWTRTVFELPKMDCPTEERLVRLALAEVEGIGGLEFDLPGRSLSVVHSAAVESVEERLVALGMGARRVGSSEAGPPSAPAAQPPSERRTLRLLLGINATMFVAEILAGWLAQSTGLLADALDMLADAAVYGLALGAVGHSTRRQLRAAHVSGWLQMALALGALAEVLRRFVVGSEPEPAWMMGVSTVALAANVLCLYLVSGHREGGAHMKASWIFSTNDVLANLGVIAAAVLVGWTQSRIPDLLIGGLIAGVVLGGAVRILRLRAHP